MPVILYPLKAPMQKGKFKNIGMITVVNPKMIESLLLNYGNNG
jgi:hypothetical protein